MPAGLLRDLFHCSVGASCKSKRYADFGGGFGQLQLAFIPAKTGYAGWRNGQRQGRRAAKNLSMQFHIRNIAQDTIAHFQLIKGPAIIAQRNLILSPFVEIIENASGQALLRRLAKIFDIIARCEPSHFILRLKTKRAACSSPAEKPPALQNASIHSGKC